MPNAQKDTPAVAARIAAGLTRRQAAEALRVTPDYLRHVECGCSYPYVLAMRAARLYRCDALALRGVRREDHA